MTGNPRMLSALSADCGPPAAPVRVLVADPHPVCRAGVRAALASLPGVAVVGEAGDGPSAVALAAELGPDLVVTEAGLPGLAWAELAAGLRAGWPGIKLVALSEGAAPGADARVPKRAAPGELARAVLAAAGGATYAGHAAPDTELSEREASCVRLLALGYSNKEIACRLVLSVKTVETYKARAMEKLGVRSRVGLVRYAADLGWLAVGANEPAAATARGS